MLCGFKLVTIVYIYVSVALRGALIEFIETRVIFYFLGIMYENSSFHNNFGVTLFNLLQGSILSFS